jgi:hypothetical protein
VIAIPDLLVFSTPGQGSFLSGITGVSIREIPPTAEMDTGDSPAAFLMSGEAEWSEADLRAFPREKAPLIRG